MQANGHAIREIRERSGLSLSGLAGATGIDLTTISRIENGKRPGTEEQIVEIARALKTPLLAIINSPAA